MRSNPDEATRRLERRWRESGDERAAWAYFNALARAREWSAGAHPELFWTLLALPGGSEAMLQAARSLFHGSVETFSKRLSAIAALERMERAGALSWETRPNAYIYLRAYQMGPMGRVEVTGYGNNSEPVTERFYVSASRRRSPRTVDTTFYNGSIELPGDTDYVLVSASRPRAAGRHMKRPAEPMFVIFPDMWETVRIMKAAPRKTDPQGYHTSWGRYRWKNNPGDEGRRRAERAAFGGDPRAEAAALRNRLRSGTLDPQNVRLAALLGYGPAQLVIDYRPVDPPYIQPDDVVIMLAQDNEWGHYMSAFWAYACVKGAQWIWDEVNGDPRRPRVSMAPNRTLELIERWLDGGDPCREASESERLMIEGYLDRLRDVIGDLEVNYHDLEQVGPGCTCEAPQRATCGNCERSWCDRCDPTPSWGCPFCHGRGESDAEIRTPGAEEHVYAIRVESTVNWIEGLEIALTIWGDRGGNMHAHWRDVLWGNRHTTGDRWTSEERVSLPLFARYARNAYRQAVWAVDLYRGGANKGRVLDKAQLDVDLWTRRIMIPRLLA